MGTTFRLWDDTTDEWGPPVHRSAGGLSVHGDTWAWLADRTHGHTIMLVSEGVLPEHTPQWETQHPEFRAGIIAHPEAVISRGGGAGGVQETEPLAERLVRIAASARPYGEGWFVKGDLDDLRMAADAILNAREIVERLEGFLDPSVFSGQRWPLHESARVGWARIDEARRVLEQRARNELPLEEIVAEAISVLHGPIIG